MLSTSLLLRGLYQAELVEEIDRLATACLNSIDQGLRSQEPCEKMNLETLGTLCLALIPFLSKPSLRRYTDRAKKLLTLTLPPVLQRKINLWQSPPKEATEAYETRYPALTFYQMLKSYLWVYRILLTTHQKDSEEVRQIKAWVQKLYGYLQKMQGTQDTQGAQNIFLNSLEFIVELEAEDPVDMMDLLVEQYGQEMKAYGKAVQFDINAVFAFLSRGSLGPLQGKTGLDAIPSYDWYKKHRNQAGEQRYSVLAHLTQGKMKPLWVKLPRFLNPQLLARTLIHNNQHYRFDLFGGSRMKPDSDPSANHHGQLLAVPVVDTLEPDCLSATRLSIISI